MRSKLSSGFYFDSTELLDKKPAERVSTISTDPKVEIRKPEGYNLNQNTVLIMMDNEYPTPELFDLVDELGYSVQSAHSSRKFIDIAKHQHLDLMILGFNTGGKDGIDVIIDNRDQIGSEVPIILLVPVINTDMISRAREAGISELVKVPFQRESVKNLIKKHVKRASMAPVL